MNAYRGLWAVALLAACTTEPPPAPDAPPPAAVQLSPSERLVRVSMTLRGRRPSLADLQRVTADPGALEAIVDGYLQTPEFGTVMKDLHAETFLVRVDPTYPFQSKGDVANRTVGEMSSVYEEPLRLIEYVIMHDRPYSEIVTADYAISDPITSVVWGMTHDGSSGLAVSHWLDTRPVSGILSSSGLYARHLSAGANYHRGRANMLSTALLCFDFLHADIELDTSIDLANPVVVSNAVRDNPACAGCHQTLDPLASSLFGFQDGARYNSYPVPMWRPAEQNRWQMTTGRSPAFFGQPVTTVVDVGRRIAADPRFPRCTVSRFAAYFMQTDRGELPFAWVAGLTDRFIASNLDAKALAKDIVMSDEFAVSHASDTATPEEADALHGMLHIRPEQLDGLFEDLTGFRWLTTDTLPMLEPVGTGGALVPVPYGQANLLRSDFAGFRALAGGIDSYFVTRPTHTTNAVSSLVLRALAATAAGYVVDDDFNAGSGPRHLLTDVSTTETSEPAIRAQLATLHARIYGALDPAAGPEVSETYELFARALARTGDVRHAWKTTLTAMFGDVRVAHY